MKYRETVDPTSPHVVMFSPANSPAPYFAEYGWVQQGGSPHKLPDRETLWQADEQRNADANKSGDAHVGQ